MIFQNLRPYELGVKSTERSTFVLLNIYIYIYMELQHIARSPSPGDSSLR